jgi:hypothetical protein
MKPKNPAMLNIYPFLELSRTFLNSLLNLGFTVSDVVRSSMLTLSFVLNVVGLNALNVALADAV